MKKNNRNHKKFKKKPAQPSAQKANTIPQRSRASLYGFHAVEQAWLNAQRHIDALYVTDAGLKSFEATLNQAHQAQLKRPEPQILDKNALEKTLPQGAVHQGLALVCPLIEDVSVQDFIIAAEHKPSMLVMLDQVTDPHNVGAILRSACVFGLNGVILQRKHAPLLDGVLAKTACGAVEHVPVAYETNLNRCIETLQDAGFFIFGLDERGGDLADLKTLPDKTVLVMGSEGPGLRRLIKENCDSLLRLPTEGKISSLNVSNAAAVTFYALKSLQKIKSL